MTVRDDTTMASGRVVSTSIRRVRLSAFIEDRYINAGNGDTGAKLRRL
jgi:hypothetical protein